MKAWLKRQSYQELLSQSGSKPQRLLYYERWLHRCLQNFRVAKHYKKLCQPFLFKQLCLHGLILQSVVESYLTYRIRYTSSDQDRELCFSAWNLKSVRLLDSRQPQNRARSDVPASRSQI